jgi:hypothetical protein
LSRRRPARRAIALAVCVILAPLVARPAGAQEATPTPAPTPFIRPTRPPTPVPGEVEIRRDGDRYNLVVKDAPRMQVLRELGAVAGFEAFPGRLQPHRMTFESKGVTLQQAIERASEGVPFFLVFEYDQKRKAHSLKRVLVGENADRRARMMEMLRKQMAEEKARRAGAPVATPTVERTKSDD